jgi:hypothetical protein
MTDKIEYQDTSLGIIENSSILNVEDLAKIQGMKRELLDVFEKAQTFRTPTEMRIAVLDDIRHPTPDSKYWQSVREQNVMFQELVMLSYEYRKNAIEIKKLRRDLASETDELECELLQVEIEKKTFIGKNQERTANGRIQEILEWHVIKEDLEPQLAAGVENVDAHQLISYATAWINQSVVMGGDGSPSERINLQSKLRSAILRCIEFGVLDTVLSYFPESVQHQIRIEYSGAIALKE